MSVLHQLISKRAAEIPDKTAITFGKQKITYKALNEQANQLAAVLIKNDVRKGDIVAFSLDRSTEMVIAILAIMKTGAVYMPLDPQFPLNRINYMLADSQAVVLLTSKKYASRYQSNVKELLIEEEWQNLKDHPTTDPEVTINYNDLVYVLYTSGSTGMPKGVQIAHHNLVNFLYSMQKAPGLNADDKLLAVTTISFDIAGLELFLPLLTGAEIIMADSAASKDGRLLLEIIRKENVNVMQATPYTWRIMLEAGWDETTPVKVICGGEALPMELAQRILNFASSLWNVYGPTETTIWSTIKQITADDQVISIGRPIDNTSIYILDESLKLLGPGIVGEIYIGGEGVAKGYLNRPELTLEKFFDDPFYKNDGNKMYRTGDLGKFMANGEIECLGRIDAQVKIRGYRIETNEIEYQLVNGTNIKEAVVIARPDNLGIDMLVAFVVVEHNEINSLNQIEDWKKKLKDILPDYMVPDSFIIISEIPLTPNGKIDKKALAQYEAPTAEESKEYVEPSTDIEKLVAKIWVENLGIKRAGIYDNFFDLGGNSLMVTIILNQLNSVLEANLTLPVFFRLPTIKQPDYIDNNRVDEKNSFILLRAGKGPPLFMFPGKVGSPLTFINFLNYYKVKQPIYCISYLGDHEFSVFEDIQAYVKYLLTQIKLIQPEGPYNLFGYSFGGTIAFEIALQLQQMGEDVDLLGIVSAEAPLKKSLLPNQKILREFKFLLRPDFYLLKKYVRYRVPYLYKTLINKYISPKLGMSSGYSKTIVEELCETYNTPLKYKGDMLLIYEDMKRTVFSEFNTSEIYTTHILADLWKNNIIGKIIKHKFICLHGDFFIEPTVGDIANILQKQFKK